MSGFKRTLGKRGAQASLLALVVVAALAVSGIGASSALALEPTCPAAGEGIAIEGKGSSLQKVAQTVWTGREVFSAPAALEHPKEKNEKGEEFGYAKACPGAPVSYSSVGSASGLKAFGFTAMGIENGVGGGNAMSFIGTDDAPTAAQIETAEASAAEQNAKAEKVEPVIVPVAETSIAVVFNAPEGCTPTFNSTHGITWKQLGKIFGGSVTTWSEIEDIGTKGVAACEKEITRVVREDGSGTTYQFKNYLAELTLKHGGANMPCSLKGFNEATGVEENTKEWAKMKAIHTAASGPNTLWPETGCEGLTLTALDKVNGGGGVAKFVAEKKGSIGYAALPDAKANGASVAWLQNGGPEPVTFARPDTTTETSNCGERVYDVPAAGQAETGTGTSVDWSQVFGASPTVGGSLYPLCTLTYIVAWSDYEKTGYTNAAKRTTTVKDYVTYILDDGQGIDHWYQPLPSTPTEHTHDVLGAAKLALSKI